MAIDLAEAVRVEWRDRKFYGKSSTLNKKKRFLRSTDFKLLRQIERNARKCVLLLKIYVTFIVIIRQGAQS